MQTTFEFQIAQIHSLSTIKEPVFFPEAKT